MPRDLLDDDVYHDLLEKAHKKCYAGAWFGPPCGPRCRSRGRGAGPRKLVSKEASLGVPGLTPGEIRTITRANKLLFRVLSLGMAVHMSEGFVGVENPEEWEDTVAIWELDAVIHFIEKVGALVVTFDQEPWGGTHGPSHKGGFHAPAGQGFGTTHPEGAGRPWATTRYPHLLGSDTSGTHRGIGGLQQAGKAFNCILPARPHGQDRGHHGGPPP